MKSKYIIFVHGWKWEKVILKAINELAKNLKMEDPCPNPGGEKTFHTLKKHLNSTSLACEFIFYDYSTALFTIPKIKPETDQKEKDENKLDFIPNAKALLEQIEKIKIDYIEACRNTDCGLKQDDLKIALIGHSAGGIVIRQALVLAEQEALDVYKAAELVKLIILIVSPSNGSPVIPEWLLRPIPNVLEDFSFLSRQIIELCFNSSFISELNSEWEKVTKCRTNLVARCIYASSDPFAPAPRKGECIIDNQAITILNTNHNDILNNCHNEVKTILDNNGFK